MAEEDYDIPKGTLEIFDLHPDQLAKYNLGGENSDFEKMLQYGQLALDIFGKYLNISNGNAPFFQGNNTLIGDPGTIPPDIYDIGSAHHTYYENLQGATEHEGRMLPTTNEDVADPRDIKEVSELFGDAGYLRPNRMNQGVVHAGLRGGLLDSSQGVTENGGGDTLPDRHGLSVVSPYEIIVKAAEARVNSVLEERSFVDFEFPHPHLKIRRVAMWENPEITETRSPNYARQAIVQRNEPARLYVGSDPRKVTLRFTYTLPFIEEYLYKANTKPVGFTDDAASPRPLTAAGGLPSHSPSTVKQEYLKYIQSVLRDHLGVPGTPGTLLPDTFTAGRGAAGWEFQNKGLKGPTVWDGLDRKQGISSPIEAGGPLPQGLHGWAYDGETMGGPQMEAIAYTLFVIDTIRASVIGDNMDNLATYGPPVARFRHGIVFTQNPFIVTSYNIDFTNKAGYDPRTLIPRQIRFSLELEEFHQTTGSQHGDFNEDLPGSSTVLDLNSSVKNSLRLL